MYFPKLKHIKRRLNLLLYKLTKINKRQVLKLLIISSIFGIVLLTPITKVDVSITNQQLITKQDINNIEEIVKQNKFFLVNPSSLAKKIQNMYPYINSINIQKKILGHVTIQIKETNYLALVKNNEKYYLLTTDGRLIILPDEKNNLKVDLPIILIKNHQYLFIDTVTSLLKKYYSLLEDLPNPDDYKIKEIQLQTDIRAIPTIKIETTSKIILFSPTKDITLQLEELKIIATQLSSKQISFKNIDLRFDRPVIK